jgi:pimeloyl-ACP methyl ester carboxylesterase
MAESSGVQLIGLDRPGIGRSDAKAGYRLLDWPDDVVEVADGLGIERFAVEGLSGGGPYALACAHL